MKICVSVCIEMPSRVFQRYTRDTPDLLNVASQFITLPPKEKKKNERKMQREKIKINKIKYNDNAQITIVKIMCVTYSKILIPQIENP